ncbi:MAG: M13 family metallopeptidase, partial [Hymenobacteraceae bacterium]|nr:M13 family metallopeptidase [Hymenobacteraceae bacterium]
MIVFSRSAAFAAGLLLIGSGCGPTKQPAAKAATPAAAPMAAAPTAPPPPPVKKGVGITTANFDTSVDPCTDFFQYANGSWIKNNPIPGAEVRWGAFNELADRNNAILRNLLETAAKTPGAAGTNQQKVGDYFAAGMDTMSIEKAGLQPLQAELARIKSIKTLGDLQKVLAHHQVIGTGALFNLGVGQDDKISTQYAVFAGQSGLGLPDKDMYLKDDKRSEMVRGEYRKYLTQIFKLSGESDADAGKHANAVFALEKRLASASKGRVELRDPYANYNKMSVAALSKQAPNFNWALQLQEIKLGTAKEIIVGQPKFLAEASTLLKTVGIADWQAYLKAKLLSSFAGTLPMAYTQASFDFFSKTLNGAKAMQPRWKRILRATDGALGEAFGQLYVEKAFTPAAKKRAQELVQNLQLAFSKRIDQLDWMTPATKTEAQKKLRSFTVKIGYPDKWKDYSALKVERSSYAANVLRAREWGTLDNSSKFGKPVDRLEWGMTPPTVNAYYNPGMNEIVFPAGILQPPFYDPNADDAVNYGGIGAVIGHEITHGFDDQGRLYDAQGNLKSWWTPQDSTQFAKRTGIIDRQYSAYSPLDSVFVNGKLTMGENIADIGGLNIAYGAFKMAPQFKNNQSYDGLTP